jgi:N-acetylmuramoyl-L-alanine amidase
MIFYFGAMRGVTTSDHFFYPKKKHFPNMPAMLFSFFYLSRPSDERNIWKKQIKKIIKRRKRNVRTSKSVRAKKSA